MGTWRFTEGRGLRWGTGVLRWMVKGGDGDGEAKRRRFDTHMYSEGGI